MQIQFGNTLNTLDIARKRFIYVVTVIAFVLLVIFALFVNLQTKPVVAIIELIVAGILLYSILKLLRQGNIESSGIVLSCVVIFMSIFLFLTGGVEQTGHYWIFIVPLMIYFLLNIKIGSFILIVYGIAILALTYFGINGYFSFPYDFIIMRQTFIIFCTLSLFSFYIALSFIKAQDKIKKTSDKLKKLNDKLETRIEVAVNKAKENERLLIQQNKLISMSEMMRNIAHHWRQPLNNIALQLQDLEDAQEFGELNDVYLKQNIKKGMQSINQLSKTIDDFSNFFRTDDIKVEFDIKKIFEDVSVIMSAQLISNNITLEIKSDEKTAINIWAYPNEFKQIILNLVQNAHDAILNSKLHSRDKNGKISIRYSKNKDWFDCEIKDSGGGIKDEIINRIFEPYYTTKKQSSGVGMGLYMSKMIIEKSMNGTIEVENISGGASFRFRCPINTK